MPRLRPRSATSSRISLIGELALARRVLVELVEHDEQQRPARCRSAPCRSNARCSVTPTTKRWARSCRLWRSTTVTCASAVLDAVHAGRVGDVGPDERRQRALRRQQAADERVDRAHADAAAGPVRARVVVVVDPVDDEVDEIVRRCAARAPSICQAPSSPPAAPSRASSAATLWTTIVYCWRSSSASANTNGSSSLVAELLRSSSRSVRRRRAGVATSGPAFGSPAPGRRVHRDAVERPGGSPSVAVPRLGRLGRAGCWLVEEQEVLALHVEDRAPWCWPPRRRARPSGTAL